MTADIGFRVHTFKELFDAQIAHDGDQSKLIFFSREAENLVLAKAFARMKSNGWALRAVQTTGLIFQRRTYIFEQLPSTALEANS